MAQAAALQLETVDSRTALHCSGYSQEIEPEPGVEAGVGGMEVPASPSSPSNLAATAMVQSAPVAAAERAAGVTSCAPVESTAVGAAGAVEAAKSQATAVAEAPAAWMRRRATEWW